jgi:Fe-S cluster assembly protein SufB
MQIQEQNDPHWKNTKSTIISKGISAGKSQNSYRGLVKVMPSAKGARNFSQCDSY